jgi:PAS domain S-box-containing protein
MTESQIKVLLIEDNPGDVRLIREMLKGKNHMTFDMICVDRLKTGIEQLAQGNIDLILLDLGLPDSSGLDTFAKLYAREPNLPIIVLTGLDDERLGLEAVIMGAQDYLVKSQVSGNLLIPAVRYAIERKKMVANIEQLNTLLETITSIDRLIIRERDAQELIREACDNFIKSGGYHAAWIMLFDEANIPLLVAEAGIGKAFSGLISRLKQGESTECVKRALVKPGISIIEDIFTACGDCPLKNVYKRYKSMCSRLEYDGKIYGIVNVLKPVNYALDKKERELLAEASNDIAFALNKIELEEERSRAEAALKESERNYRELANSISDTFFEMDKDLKYTYWNRASEELTGISARDAIGKSLYDLFPDIKGTKADKAYLEVLRTQRPQSFVNEYQLGGEQLLFEISAYPSKRGISVFVRDVTKAQKAKEALRASEELYRELVEKARMAILMDNKDGNFVYFNKKYAELFGYSMSEMKKRSIQTVAHPDDVERVMEFHKKRIKGEKVPSRYEFRGVRKDGSIIHLEVDAVELKGEEKIVGTRSYVWDITVRKKAEEKVEASLREKEILLREVHHRVKNNMQVISSLFNLQSRYIKDKKSLEIFRNCQNRVRSMALIHERLYQAEDLAKVDIEEYVQSLISHLFSSYGISPEAISLSTDIKNVFLDIGKAIPCGLIINELVSNSLKHAFPDRKKGEMRISLKPLDKNEIELMVSDNGVGLPKEVDFQNVESLGLHLVTILAKDQLHGTVELDRSSGTKFVIRFRKKI